MKKYIIISLVLISCGNHNKDNNQKKIDSLVAQAQSNQRQIDSLLNIIHSEFPKAYREWTGSLDGEHWVVIEDTIALKGQLKECGTPCTPFKYLKYRLRLKP